MDKQLSEIVKTSGLDTKESQSIVESFGNYEAIAKEWEVKAKAIVVTDKSQTIEMAMAKEARKRFSALRIDVERARKAMKEQSLRKGQAIDAVAKFLVSLIAPIEEHLRRQEDFVKLEDERKLAELKAAEEKKAEEERIAKEKAEAEERERIRLENEKLKKEAEIREKKLADEKEKARIEKEKAQKKLDDQKKKAEADKKKLQEEQAKKLEAERLEKEKAQNELKAKELEEAKKKKEAEEAETKRLADIEAAKREALARPDKEKYDAYMTALLAVEIPAVDDLEVSKKIEDVVNYLLKAQQK